MKKYSFVAVILVLVCLVTLTACGGGSRIHLKDVPEADATVYGNGGYSVIKGGYLYFTDSYLTSSDLGKKDNNSGKVKTSALYRTKLKTNGDLDLNDDKILKSYEQVVSKVVGFENTGLYIFDNYIYFTTPNNSISKDGTLNNSWVDFCRVKLNGTSYEKLYTAQDYKATYGFKYVKIGSNIYLTLLDGTDLVEVNANNGKSRVLAENVTSIMFNDKETYEYVENKSVNGNERYVYYTRSIKDEDGFIAYTGNILGRASLGVQETNVERLGEVNSETITYELISVKDNFVYFNKTIDSKKVFYASKLNITETFDDFKDSAKDAKLLETSSFTNIYVLDNENAEHTGFIYTFNSKTFVRTGALDGGYSNCISESVTTTQIANREITVSAVKGKEIYYIDGTTINIINYAEPKNDKDEYQSTLIVSDSNMQTTNFDFGQDGVVYYFAKYTGPQSESGIYMNRVVISESNKILPDEDADENADTNLGYNYELVGVLKSAHTPVEED